MHRTSHFSNSFRNFRNFRIRTKGNDQLYKHFSIQFLGELNSFDNAIVGTIF
jgi:hypothetical protein